MFCHTLGKDLNHDQAVHPKNATILRDSIVKSDFVHERCGFPAVLDPKRHTIYFYIEIAKTKRNYVNGQYSSNQIQNINLCG